MSERAVAKMGSAGTSAAENLSLEASCIVFHTVLSSFCVIPLWTFLLLFVSPKRTLSFDLLFPVNRSIPVRPESPVLLFHFVSLIVLVHFSCIDFPIGFSICPISNLDLLFLLSIP